MLTILVTRVPSLKAYAFLFKVFLVEAVVRRQCISELRGKTYQQFDMSLSVSDPFQIPDLAISTRHI